MKVYVMCDSITGNTDLLASVIKEVYKDKLVEDVKSADYIFVGSWTQRGMCSEKVKVFLSQLKKKKVFLFGTCGFGEDVTYFEKIYERTASFLDDSNEIIGHYYCQGKMPLAIKDKYEKLLKDNPEDQNLQISLKNFDNALEHPNTKDLEKLRDTLEKIIHD